MFSCWKDRRAVEEDKLECLEHIIMRGLETRENPDHIVLVHCSAGIGRTGTYIAILLMIESNMYQVKALKREPHISIFGTVRRLREQRYNTVTQEVQYKFLYSYMRRWVCANQHRIKPPTIKISISPGALTPPTNQDIAE